MQLNFDATQVAPQDALETIPAGWYNAMIDQSEIKPTKDGAGNYLELRFNVIEGQYAGRKVFTRLNIRNSNPQAQEIAFKQLSAICHAVQVLNVQDSQQLHGRPLAIKVSVRAASGDYEASNEVKGFKAAQQGQPAPAFGMAAPQPFAPQAAPQPATPQWAAQPAQPFAPPVAAPAPFAAPPMQAPQQFAPAPAAPVQAAPQQQWQPTEQPWMAAPTQVAAPAPVQQVAAPAQQAAPQAAHPAQGAMPPWMAQAPAQ